MAYKIIQDDSAFDSIDLKSIISKIENAIASKVNGSLICPSRFHVDVKKGSLVFTAGAETKHEKIIGFRIYDTFKTKSENKKQLTAVFDAETGEFKGLVISDLVGGIRTGAIGGVAVKYMSRKNSETVGILGSGLQARAQLQAVAAIRKIKMIKVYSPNPENRKNFVDEMSEKLGFTAQSVDSAKDAVKNTDILICATTSSIPIFDPSWISPGTHINTIGPKFKNRHELDIAVADKAKVIATDSRSQIDSYLEPFFLSASPHLSRIIELTDIITNKEKGRFSDNDITLFCSVGLSGTEIIVANELLK